MAISNLKTGTAVLEEAELYYELAGEGEWLVLVHAGIADRTMWEEQFATFAQHYRILRYDMRGFGNSPITPALFSHCQDLHNLLAFFRIEKAHLLGCSQGGATVIDFALEHPEMVTSLTLVSSVVSGYEFEGELPAKMLDLMDALGERDLTRAAEVAVQIWADGPKRTPEQVDAGVREQIREMGHVALRNQLPEATREEMLEPPAIGRLSELDAPALVVIGELDDDSILDIADLLREEIIRIPINSLINPRPPVEQGMRFDALRSFNKALALKR